MINPGKVILMIIITSLDFHDDTYLPVTSVCFYIDEHDNIYIYEYMNTLISN